MTKNQTEDQSPFAIKLERTTELGLAMLIAEYPDGSYEPITVAGTVNEAEEIADTDFGFRLRGSDCAGTPTPVPVRYRLWARAFAGDYFVAADIDPVTPTEKPVSNQRSKCQRKVRKWTQ
jgi:hypothetical protein